MSSRADRNRNPAAFTTDVARQAGLRTGVDYVDGDLFPPPSTLKTAKLLGDPIALTIQVIDRVSYYKRDGTQRWTYIAIPTVLWQSLTEAQKRIAIAFHYGCEGGTEMRDLFR